MPNNIEQATTHFLVYIWDSGHQHLRNELEGAKVYLLSNTCSSNDTSDTDGEYFGAQAYQTVIPPDSNSRESFREAYFCRNWSINPKFLSNTGQ